MHYRNILRSFLIFTSVAAMALGSGAALAAGHGGGGGGHSGGGWHGGGGGHDGGHGWHDGGHGWHDGGRGFHDGFGWRGRAGLGLGLYFATLPLYYSTFWWGGIPYYYVDDTYYEYDGSLGQYETVAPPPEVQKQAAAEGSAGMDVIAYPKNGQTAEQQANDKYDCHRWAVTQSGFDFAQGVAASAQQRDQYMRAQAACLDGRGYSVK